MRKLFRGFILVLILAVMGLAACRFNMPEVDVPFIPTRTVTPAPTRTPLPTSTYPPKLPYDNELFLVEVLENSESVLTDRELGYQVQFSPEWLVVPLDADMQDALVAISSEELSDQMQQILTASLEEAGIRIVALDYTLAFNQTESSVANITIVYQQDLASANYELGVLLDGNAAVVPTLIPDAMVTYQAIQTNSNGIEYAKMVINYPASVFGQPLKQLVMMVKLDDGLLVITGSVEESMYSAAEPAFLRIFNSLSWVE